MIAGIAGFGQAHAYSVKNNFLIHDGDRRYFDVYLPDSYNGTSELPVVLVFHGGGGSMDGIAQQTRMHETGDKKGFITIYPQGISSKIGNFHTWNAGKCCGRAARENIDDVGFVRKILESVRDRYSVDLDRVYATGHSNGAMMSYRLACELSDMITAIAPNAGTAALEKCDALRPVPILHFHGTADKCSKYEGGDCGGCFAEMLGIMGSSIKEQTRKCEAVPQMVGAMAVLNGCSNLVKEIAKSGNVVCKAWQRCKASVTLCTVNNGGHTWPGGDYGADLCERPKARICRKYKDIVGNINNDVSANDMMWSFFKEYEMPEAEGPQLPE